MSSTDCASRTVIAPACTFTLNDRASRMRHREIGRARRRSRMCWLTRGVLQLSDATVRSCSDVSSDGSAE
jgi:hypothetical protein